MDGKRFGEEEGTVVTLKCMLFTGYFSGTHYATIGTHFDNDFEWQRTYDFL